MEPVDPLWRRLRAFAFDDPDAGLPFSRRLARDCGWSHRKALAAIEEYRRFVYLAMTAGHHVTPSDEVDQVWHLHLCYTRSYWDEMCGEVLGRPLHHGPTRGGDQQRAQFDDWYRRTLASYRRTFAQAPPTSLWPAPERRFRQARWRRVDVGEVLLVPRRELSRLAAAAAATVGLSTIAGCTSLIGDDAATLVLLLAVIGMVMLVYHFVRHSARGGDGSEHGLQNHGCGSPNCNDDEDASGGDSGCGAGCGGCGD